MFGNEFYCYQELWLGEWKTKENFNTALKEGPQNAKFQKLITYITYINH